MVYDPACDVNHDNQITIDDIQLTAGHWNQSGTWLSDNNHTHLGQAWTGANNPLRLIGSYGIPEYAALYLSNSADGGDGLYVSTTGGAALRVGWADGDGLRVYSAGGNGVSIASAGWNGVDATSTSATHYGGRFTNSAAGGTGVYSRSGSNAAADVILGGTSAADDGRIYSEPSLTGSDILLLSNDEVHVHLDEDDNSSSAFSIYDGANTNLWSVGETGTAVAAGPSAVQVNAGSQGKRLAYAVTSPQNWIEDFGSGQLKDGEAVIELEAAYAETLSTEEPYHVFLTPLGDCALYVVEKAAASFSVRALGGERCNIAFDYRIVGLRRGYETVRMEQYVEVSDE
jgi:hypothetical protein